MKNKISIIIAITMLLSLIFTVNVFADNISVYVDNELVQLTDATGANVYPFIQNGTTYVPLRGVSQVLGCWVRWNGQTKTVSVYMNVCPPNGVTLTENKPYDLSYCWGYYENEGQYLKINDSAYTNALEMKRSGDAFALFNLDGKYSSMTMTVGSYDDFEVEKEVVFIVDGKIVETYKLLPNSPSKNIQIKLNEGLQLKIKINGWYVGMGDIIFWGE